MSNFLNAAKKTNLILIIEDSHECIQVLVSFLKKDFRIAVAMSGEEALEKIDEIKPDIILLDIFMPGMSGEEVLKVLSENYSHIPVIITTSATEPDYIINCMKLGAFDYLIKPIDEVRTITAVKHALKWDEQEKVIKSLKNKVLKEKPENPKPFKSIITNNKKMFSIFNYIESIAKTNLPVMILGETGVGKELFAKAVHESSQRKGNFVAVNIAGLDDHLFSDTLFGHLKGAFTGAGNARNGLVEKAVNGTLFLDEIGDIDNISQVKLLRLIQEKEYFPLGSDDQKYSNARLILATNQNLNSLIQDKVFRQDLYYRLQAHCIYIPPLRERKDDIPLLFDFFLETSAEELNKKIPSYPDEIISLLKSYCFPGNIRELSGMVYEAMIRHNGKMLSMNSFEESIARANKNESVLIPSGIPPIEEYFQAISSLPTANKVTSSLIKEAIKRSEGNKSLAAKLIEMNRCTLANRLNEFESDLSS